MIRGSCLCGAVRFEIDGPLRHITHCHCGMCRKAHGAAFATYAQLGRKRLRIVEGEVVIRRFASSPRVHRESCGTCGSPLFWSHLDHPSVTSVAVGALDDDPIGRPEAHIYWASRACWLEMQDDLRRYDEDPPG